MFSVKKIYLKKKMGGGGGGKGGGGGGSCPQAPVIQSEKLQKY